jgi:hypothetical protein
MSKSFPSSTSCITRGICHCTGGLPLSTWMCAVSMSILTRCIALKAEKTCACDNTVCKLKLGSSTSLPKTNIPQRCHGLSTLN